MKKFLAVLFSTALLLSALAPASIAAEQEALPEGAFQLEFETLAQAANAGNLLTEAEKPGDVSVEYASGKSLWGNTGTHIDPSAAFTFTAPQAGYYDVYYALGNAGANTVDLSQVSLTVNDELAGDNIKNNTQIEDLSQYQDNENGGKTRIYPWQHMGMTLFKGSSVCYLNEGENTLKAEVTISGGNYKAFKFFADYIQFVPVQGKVVQAGDGLTRIELPSPLKIKASASASFDFTVLKDGNYAFMANRNTDYSDGTLTATVTEQDSGAETAVCTDVGWNGAASGQKPYARVGTGTTGTVALKANVPYTFTITSSAGFTTSYFDVICTDIDVSGKTLIPSHYYTRTNQNTDHFLNNHDFTNEMETYIPANYPEYAIVGQPKSGELATPWNKAPISVLITKGGYADYTLNIPKAGQYSFRVYTSVYSGSQTAYPEPVYFSVDGTKKGAVQYDPAAWTDKNKILTFQTELSAGRHTLKISRKQIGDGSTQNTFMYIPFLTAEPVKPAAAMYLGSTVEENKISLVQNGDLIAKIETNGTVPHEQNIMAFFAIYDDEKQLVRVASHIGAINEDAITLTIDNFAAEAEKKYKAKAFLWNDKLQGDSFVLAEAVGLDDLVDFKVTVPEGREPVVLQLTDPQIIDASQERTPERLGASLDAYYAKDQMDARCYSYMKEAIEATQPDLILLTGDLVYGEFDDNGSSFTKLVEFMEGFGIPWAPVFGNHENESAMGADWQCDRFENAQNCLFKQRSLTGNGNYTVGIFQGGVLKRVFFMLDSNGCGNMSNASFANGHSKKAIGFGTDQIAWYTDVGKKINILSPETKVSFAFHIPLAMFQQAYIKYGFANDDSFTPIDIDAIENKEAGDFGYLGGKISSVCDADYSAYNAMKRIGADSLFTGHLHEQSASVIYDGVRFQFGQKSSTYDQTNYRKEDGSIAFSYTNAGTPIVGGTVMKLTEQTGGIGEAFIYYCKTES